jgi:nicotinate phosphoribosyltransferase
MASNLGVPIPDIQFEFEVVSILDTDLYKARTSTVMTIVHNRLPCGCLTYLQFTMQQAVFEYYPTAQAVYRFAHRDEGRQFPRACVEKFQASLNSSWL